MHACMYIVRVPSTLVIVIVSDATILKWQYGQEVL